VLIKQVFLGRGWGDSAIIKFAELSLRESTVILKTVLNTLDGRLGVAEVV
jgi:hypothetical protein